MTRSGTDPLEVIEYEVVMLLRRADFKKTMDGRKNSLFRSGYLILNVLLKESPMSVRGLADLFQLDLSTMSRQIKALENKALIARKIEDHDGRVHQISITEAGRHAVSALKEERIRIYQGLLDDWSEEERTVFADHLARLNRKIERRKRLK